MHNLNCASSKKYNLGLGGGRLNIIWISTVYLSRFFIRKVYGIENIPKNTNFIAASNHSSYLDPFVLGAAIYPVSKRYIRFFAMASGRGFVIGESLSRKAFKVIPLGEDKEKALNEAICILKKEIDCVGIFPEGPRSIDGRLKRGKTGIIRAAIKAKKPILPVGLIGTYEIAPGEKIIPKFKRCEVKIGRPIYLNGYYNKKITKALLRKLTNRLMAEIAALTGRKYLYSGR